jgi:hypothetical protein
MSRSAIHAGGIPHKLLSTLEGERRPYRAVRRDAKGAAGHHSSEVLSALEQANLIAVTVEITPQGRQLLARLRNKQGGA